MDISSGILEVFSRKQSYWNYNCLFIEQLVYIKIETPIIPSLWHEKNNNKTRNETNFHVVQ